MTVNELLGLSPDANQAAIMDRVMSLVQNEKDLLDVTGKDNIAAALSVVIAQKDAATELEKARAAVASWEQKARDEEAANLKRDIDACVQGAIADGRISVKDTDRHAQLVKHGEKFGIESLRETVAMLSPRPVRAYQAPMAANSDEARIAAVKAYQAANPGMSFTDAYTKMVAERPSLFEGGR